MVLSGRRLPEMFLYSALVGSTVDTNLRQSTVLIRISAQCLVRQWIQFAALVVVSAVAWLLLVCWLRCFRAVFTSSSAGS